MDIERRRSQIHDLIFRIRSPENGRRPSPRVRNQGKTLFNAGELACLRSLLENGATQIDDLPSSIAARELERLGLVSSKRRLAQTPALGVCFTKRMELTDDGLEIAAFFNPNID